MQDYCRILLQDSQKEDGLSAAFQSALYQSEPSKNTLRTLNAFGYPTLCPYRILVLQNIGDVTIITSPLNRCKLKYHIFSYDNAQILIYPILSDDTTPLAEIIAIVTYCDNVFVGISNELTSLMELGQGYKKAHFCLAIAQLGKRPSLVFDELGVFQLLFCVSDQALLPSMYQSQLGHIEQYDQMHDTEYLT